MVAPIELGARSTGVAGHNHMLCDGVHPRDLLGHLLAHGHHHLGEIWLTRELQGKTGIGV